uniref:Transposase n=1 Tax=Romanomermis culicivorax TaxID=13658 RepID=A0A915JMU5_ROMCU
MHVLKPQDTTNSVVKQPQSTEHRSSRCWLSRPVKKAFLERHERQYPQSGKAPLQSPLLIMRQIINDCYRSYNG